MIQKCSTVRFLNLRFRNRRSELKSDLEIKKMSRHFQENISRKNSPSKSKFELFYSLIHVIYVGNYTSNLE